MPINIEAYAKGLIKSPKADKYDPWKSTGNFNRPGRMELRQMMGVHLLGEYPFRLFAEKYPTESEEIRDWLRGNYRAITRGPAQGFVKDCSRIFQGSNWSITADEDTTAYIDEPRFNGKSFMQFFASEAWPLTVLDSGAIAVTMPAGPGLTNPSIRVDAEVWLLETKQVYERPSKHRSVLSWEDYEGNYYQDGDKEIKGRRFWVVDDEWYYRIDQGNSNKDYAITEYYRHNTGSVPQQPLGGVPERRQNQKDGEGIIYRSFLEPFVPWADDALTSYAHYKVVEAQMAHPSIEMYAEPCNYRDSYGSDCVEGYIRRGGQSITCPSCNGSGNKSPWNKPGEATLRPMPTGSETDPKTKMIGTPLRTDYRPPVDGLNAMWEKVKERIELAKDSINKRWIQQAQSGTAKSFDKEGEYATIQDIANWEFGTVIQNTLFNIVKLRFPNTWQTMRPEVSIPNDFSLLSESDLIDRLDALRTANAPMSVYQEAIIQYIDKVYTNQSKVQRKLKLAVYLDPLHVYTPDIRDQSQMNRSATVEDLIRSNFIYSIINETIFDFGDQALDNPISWWRTETDKRLAERNAAAAQAAVIEPLNPPVNAE